MHQFYSKEEKEYGVLGTRIYEQIQTGNIKDISIIDKTCNLYEKSKKGEIEL